MSSATIITLADAVVADLNTLGSTEWVFTATRTYLPKFDLSDSADLQVQVVPKSDGRSPASRGYDSCDLTVDVGIMQRIEGSEAEELALIDSLLEFAEVIKEFLSRLRPTNYGSAVCTSVKNDPIYSVDHLNEKRVFLTVISATFQADRPVRCSM